MQVGELDPLNRRLSTARRPDVMVQGEYISFISGSRDAFDR